MCLEDKGARLGHMRRWIETLMTETLAKNQTNRDLKVSQACSANKTKLVRVLGQCSSQSTSLTMSMQERKAQKVSDPRYSLGKAWKLSGQSDPCEVCRLSNSCSPLGQATSDQLKTMDCDVISSSFKKTNRKVLVSFLMRPFLNDRSQLQLNALYFV
jgi:hypothetical protein